MGRRPLTDNLGLEGTKVELDRGFVKVDSYQRTGEPNVYAIGDVVAGTPQLAHVATAEGMIAIGLHRGQAGHADQQESHSQRDLYRTRNRQRGDHGGAGALHRL